MSERSPRLSPGTPADMVIAALNGLADRVDAIEAKGKPIEPATSATAVPTSILLHHARILGRVRDVANGEQIWPVRLNRRIEAGTLVHDGDWNMAWVVEVDHDDPEGFSSLRVQPLTPPGH